MAYVDNFAGFIPDTGLSRYMTEKPTIPPELLKDAKSTKEGTPRSFVWHHYIVTDILKALNLSWQHSHEMISLEIQSRSSSPAGASGGPRMSTNSLLTRRYRTNGHHPRRKLKRPSSSTRKQRKTYCCIPFDYYRYLSSSAQGKQPATPFKFLAQY